MSKQKIERLIREGIDKNQGDSKEQGKFRQLLTVYNNLVKYDLLKDAAIDFQFGEGLEELLSDFREKLKSDGKSDSRSPLTRVRQISEIYNKSIKLDIAEIGFTTTLQKAIDLKYGDNLFKGKLTPSIQREILSSKVTYMTIARNIIELACEENPKLWPIVAKAGDKERSKKLEGSARILSDYFYGVTVPSPRYSDDRIHFIEKFLDLSKGALLGKLRRKNLLLEQTRSKPKSQSKTSHHRTNVHKHLNANLLVCFEEYRDFKVHGTQPKLKNVNAQMREDKYAARRLKVKETSAARKSSGWTISESGIASARKFYEELVFFQNYCVTEEGIAFEDVSSSHLTDPDILERMVISASNRRGGGTNPERLLNFVKRTSGKSGYLRLCADRGDRSIEDFFNDLEFIMEEYPDWTKSVKFNTVEKGKGSNKGKENIAFLLEMDAFDRRNSVYESSKILIGEAQDLHKEAERHFMMGEDLSRTEYARTVATNNAASYIRDAYMKTITAMISEVSFEVAPRMGTWANFKYYPNPSKRDDRYCSITYLKSQNQFHMKAPLFGPSLINPSSNVRYLKNADTKNATEIDIRLPEHLTPLLKNFISIREDYINLDIIGKQAHVLSTLKEKEAELLNAPTTSFTEMLLEEIRLDIELYENVTPSDIDLFIPWRTLKPGATRIDNPSLDSFWRQSRKERRIFRVNSKKLSEYLKNSTYYSFSKLMNKEVVTGINGHAFRHLSAETYLDFNPGDFLGAAAILNDDIEQVIKTYGGRDRAKAMRKIGDKKEAFKY